MFKKSLKILLFCCCFSLLLYGCQSTPQTVKEKSRKYQNAENVEQKEIEYVSVSHIFDDKEKILNGNYQNLDLKKTIHLEEMVDSVSVLTLQVQNSFGSKEKLVEMNLAFFGNAQYEDEIEYLEKTPATEWGAYTFHFEENRDSAALYDNGFSWLSKKDSESTAERLKKIYHVDRGENLKDSYLLKNGKLSVEEAVNYVNDWCDKNWKVLEPEYQFQVKTVYVCEKNDACFYYRFDVCKYYKGMPYDDIDFYVDEDHLYIDNILDITMENKGELSFVRNNHLSYDIKKEENYNDKLIGLEQAVLLVQEKMTGGQKLAIDDIDIKYVVLSDVTEEKQKEGIHYDTPGATAMAHPTWSFIMDASDDAENMINSWNRKFINVDMVTGDVMYFDK